MKLILLLLFLTTNVFAALTKPSPSMSDRRIAVVKDERTSGTHGGSTTTSYAARIMNTVVDPSSIIVNSASMTGTGSTNTQIQLAAGDYVFECEIPFYSLNITHKARLYNATAASVIGLGTSCSNVSGGTLSASCSAHIKYKFTLAATSYVEVQDRSSTAVATTGRGVAASMGDNENYTTCLIEKVK